MRPRPCPQCGIDYRPKHSIQKFCNPDCAVNARTGVRKSDSIPDRVQTTDSPCRGRARICVIPDLHAPFHDPSMVAEMLAATAGFEVAVVMGDVMDMYSVSRFINYEKVSAMHEIQEARALLKQILGNYGQVHLICGNHDDRPERQLRERLPQDVLDLVGYMTGGDFNPLRSMIRNEFPTVKMANNVIDGRLHADWFCKVGDAIFSHAEKYSTTPGAALRSVDQWFTDFEKVVGVEGYKVVVQAHTHTMAMFPWKADRWLVECGCLCKQHGYQFRAKIGGRPQRRGYVTMEQTDGVTDPNSIRLVWLG